MTVSVLAGRSWLRPARAAVDSWNAGAGPNVFLGDPIADCERPPLGVISVCYAARHEQAHIHAPVDQDGHLNRSWIHLPPSDRRLGASLKHGTMCQEIGHALGLDHAAHGASCMYSASYASPDRHDYAELARIYAHRPGYRHWHRARWHTHVRRHCHLGALGFCVSSHDHHARHWHKAGWHRHT